MGRLILWALRARWGLSAVVMACHLSGLGVIVTELWLSGLLGRMGTEWMSAISRIAIYPTLGALAGIVLAVRDRDHYFSWLDNGRPPTPKEARRLLNLPIAIAGRALAIWLPGVAIAGGLFAHEIDHRALPTVLAMFALGAFESAGLTLLIVDRMIRPTIPMVAEVLGGAMHWSSTVLNRVVVSWIVSAAVPMLGLITVLADPEAGTAERVRTGIYLACLSILVGALATSALARAVAEPLRLLRRALDRIARGDLDVQVPIGSTSEIGRLEHSVNELAANLRERERMRDVFGRHVGPQVAERALSGSADLTGELREVTTLFVDVTGSVQLSTGLPPREFVATLNRLLATVVAATEDNGGLVNKFEGDAALCIFGAPIPMPDNATPALRAARRIRDEVLAAAELDIGIGVARGLVFAGDVGTDTRLEFTVIGDAVNEAARLTGEAKRVPRRILVSQAVIDAATAAERANWQEFETIRLRGRLEPTICWTDTVEIPADPDADRITPTHSIAETDSTPVDHATEVTQPERLRPTPQPDPAP
ncbi:adenylate/guanylate cyclase domain-containing protein [Nocardia sp. alder85J]|uniref:adenylate/guanylate cyclase domain-containing protein n=1 Tax=Nocardia sp. alder85J TaxID=2862949 RepID=UPI001CD68F6D|nr:adenylate/guanylate cyclase domain-containing protein [Nocardia sp. alder85J]MCX4096118.1 HAMP domain-containing protein [Nocardia sp. alder85J]